MIVKVNFPNNPPEPHLTIADFKNQQINLWARDLSRPLGSGHVVDLNYNDDASQGSLTLDLRHSKLDESKVYNGDIHFIKTDPIRFVRILIDA